MQEFKEFLAEIKMSNDAALKIINISAIDANNPDLLKKAYRKASMSAHPDRGGSTELMQQVNAAYDQLKGKTILSSTSQGDFKSRYDERVKEDKKTFERLIIVKNDLKNKFRPDIFINYFKSIFGKNFKWVPKGESPKGTFSSSKYYKAGFDGNFETDDRETIIYFDISASQTQSKGLGSGDISYSIGTTAYALHNNKKQKMKARDWDQTNNHDLFNKPEKTYPKAKMTKIAKGETRKGAFKKRDMETFLTKKLGAVRGGDGYMLPIGDGYHTFVYRQTFMRLGQWNIDGVFEPNPKTGRPMRMRDPQLRVGVSSLFEKEELAMFFQEMQEQVMKKKTIKDKRDLLQKLGEAYYKEAYKKAIERGE